MNNQPAEAPGPVQQRRICPACATGELRRAKREDWMRWVPFSKHYSCSKCKAAYLRVFDHFRFRVTSSGARARQVRREMAIVVTVVLLTIYVCYRLVMSLYENAVQ